MTLIRSILLVLLIALVIGPGTAAAQPNGPARDGGVLVRVDGPARIGPDEAVHVAVVVHGDAVIEGTVHDVLVVVDGSAVVSGSVGQRLVVVDGTADLQPTARIGGDVILVGTSTITQADGAVIAGTVKHEQGFRLSLNFNDHFGFFASAMLWLSMTIVTLVAGLLFAAVAGRQLSGAGALLTSNIGGSLLGALAVWIGIPLLAVLVIITIVGMPLGIGALLLLPVLGFLGYLVTGVRLGVLVLRHMGIIEDADHPYLAALLGLLGLRLVAFVPVLGLLVALVAGAIGAGALALLAWRAWRSSAGAALEPVTV